MQNSRAIVDRVGMCSLVFAIAIGLASCSGGSVAPEAREQSSTDVMRDGQMLDEEGHVRQEAYQRQHLPEAVQSQYGDIEGWRLKEALQEVTAISLQSRDAGNKYWGRIAGTEYEAMTADWVQAKFEQFGLEDIHRQPFDLPEQWFATDWEATFTSGGKSYSFESYVPALRSNATLASGIQADAIWLGTGAVADFKGRDVRGKLVILHSVPEPGSMGHTAAFEGGIARAQEQGAAAVGIIYGVSDNFALWQGLGRDITIPGFYIGFEDGKVLRELLGEGSVQANLSLDVEMREGLTSSSVWGTLPGTSDEDILVMAHMDGYYEAALDNASGLAVMMAVLEHFSKVPQDQRRRSIKFIGTAGHHVGSPGARWLHDNRDTALANTALMINCEHIAPTSTFYWRGLMRKSNVDHQRRWWVYGSEQLMDIVLDSYALFGVPLVADMDPRSSGEMSRPARDAPSLQTIRSPEIKHTAQDIPGWISDAGLEAVARSYARIIDEANRLDRQELFPRDHTPTTAP